MSKYFGIPFANSGDKTTIPDVSQPSGDVSFTDGYTPDYEKDQATDPTAKDVSRQNENYFKFVVTEALKEIQEVGGKPYDSIIDYPVGAKIAGSDNNLYRCLIANGPGASFLPVVDPVGDSTGTWILYELAYSNMAALKATLLTPVDGQPIILLGYTAAGDGAAGQFYWKAGDLSAEVANDPQSGVYVALNSDPTGSTGAFVRLHNGIINPLFFGTTDIGQSINSATAAGYLYQSMSIGAYTQSTALTQNQELHLTTPGWNGHYGFNPVTITKDGDFAHIESTTTFSSYGITWSGLGVVGTSHGIIMHSKFEIWGSVVSQPGHGLYVLESSASHNCNGSIISGGYASNGDSGIVFENTIVSDSDNIDLNRITIKAGTRCNSNTGSGILMKGGLWCIWEGVRTDNNNYGVHFDCTNSVVSNVITLYSENNITADLLVTESAPNNFRDNQFWQGRGFTGADIITSQGNVLVNAANYDGIIANVYQPWVHVLLSASQANVTGNGTVYTVPFDSVIKDTQSEYSNPTTTAKLAGSKRVTGNIYCQNVTALHTTASVEIVTTNRNYTVALLNLGAIRTAGNTAVIPFSATVDMEANETLTVEFTVSGAASDDLDILGNGTTAATYVSITSD